MKARIKTKEEFIKEFGEDWRENISEDWSFLPEMDYLLGKEIILNESQVIQYNKDNIFELLDSDGEPLWTICKEMFTLSLNNNEPAELDLSMISCQNIFCESYGKHYKLNCSKVYHLSHICNVKSCEALKKFIEYFSENN